MYMVSVTAAWAKQGISTHPITSNTLAEETAAKTDLKIDNLITVRFGCDGKNIILTFGGVAHLIINDAILKDIVLLGMMAVAIKTELQMGEIEGIIVKHLGHIVVKLL